MNRCPDLVVCLKRDLQCLRPELYDPKLPLHVFCDASLKAIGAILKQPDNSGTPHPVSFHSRTSRWYLSREEQRRGYLGQRVRFPTGGFSYCRGPFRANRTTWKRIRYGFITIKSTTLIGHPLSAQEHNLAGHQDIKSSLTKIPWTKFLEQVINEYKLTPHSVTKFPPEYLLFGTLPYTPPLAQNQVYPPVEEARKLAKENTIKYQEKK
ncbi:transposon Ty3-G Gag-Pol polyprotein [Trichonephila clavipes]|nr:transposon Ty3-G Gag-Pol polyprotein [Trichonephila clavipes]